jgi:hypothetical protein
MALIEQQEVLDALNAQAEEMSHWHDGYAEQRKGILTAVRIVSDIKPKRGKWIWNGDTLDRERLHYCSECKKYALRDTDGKYEVLSDFCPHCGADMRPGNVTDV